MMAKNYDPRMHTAEHILNQTMDRLFACGRCFSAHVNPDKAKCDYHFDRDLTEIEAREVERRVNAVVAADLTVVAEDMARGDAQAYFNLERLPEDAAETLRIIRIGDYDACPCIGEHVERSGMLGSFRLTTHSYESGVLRLRFKLGKAD
jgi:Ser-tRNA(Ala) deacylase AlaX